MYIVNIAIRWATDGALEGFGSSGLTESDARNRALSKAKNKASAFGIEYVTLTSAEYNALTVDQQDALQDDWNNESL